MILKDYSDQIVSRKLSGQEIPDRFNGAYNTYYIKEVSEDYAAENSSPFYGEAEAYIRSQEDFASSRIRRQVFADNDGKYYDHTVIPQKLSDSHIFDENLTIKENREKIQAHNEMVEHMKKEKMAKNAELSRKLTSDVVAYIMDNYNLNAEQAAIVENYVYVEKHSFMGDYFSSIDSVAEMAESIAGLS
jgi:hypothetical protein